MGKEIAKQAGEKLEKMRRKFKNLVAMSCHALANSHHRQISVMMVVVAEPVAVECYNTVAEHHKVAPAKGAPLIIGDPTQVAGRHRADLQVLRRRGRRPVLDVRRPARLAMGALLDLSESAAISVRAVAIAASAAAFAAMDDVFAATDDKFARR